MTSSYLTGIAGTRKTSQSEPIPGTDQVENSASGFAWEIGPIGQLRRFLILGSSGGSYYASERKLTKENVENLRTALETDGTRAVADIVAVSTGGRAPRNDEAIFALAMACSMKNEETKRLAIDAIPTVCRTGTHLFQFCTFVREFRGWGRALRRGVAAWYERPVADVAYQVIKYRQRDGWAHRDILRLSHPDAPTKAHRDLYDWISGRTIKLSDDGPLRAINAFVQAQAAETSADTVRLIKWHEGLLPREALVTEHLTDIDVQKTLIEHGMPYMALMRNLANLTRHGVLKPMGDTTAAVIHKLTNGQAIHKARVHPISILMAMMTYKSGRSYRGDNTWNPIGPIVDALDEAFYKAFDTVEATGKRTLIALDLSGSMDQGMVAQVPGLTPRMGAAAMAMVTARAEPNYHVVGFTGSGPTRSMNRWRYRESPGVGAMTLTPRMRLDSVLEEVNSHPFGPTDCALPMIHALEEELPVDTFVIYTDNETWNGEIHPAQALVKYREQTGIDARLVVVGMTSTGFSIADPNDAGMLDVVGFDSAAPAMIAEFSAGRL